MFDAHISKADIDKHRNTDENTEKSKHSKNDATNDTNNNEENTDEESDDPEYEDPPSDDIEMCNMLQTDIDYSAPPLAVNMHPLAANMHTHNDDTNMIHKINDESTNNTSNKPKMDD